jgi:hypothetical protein
MMPRRWFTDQDLRRWADDGIITETQLQTILALGTSEEPEREGLNLPTLLYYLGASLGLIAAGVFAGLNWDDAGEGLRAIMVAAAMAIIGAAGYWVWSQTVYKHGGGALITIAAGMLPLFFFSIGNLVTSGERTELLNEDQLDEAALLQAASLLIMVICLTWTRIGMLSIAVVGQAIALVATAAAWWFSDTDTTHFVLSVLGAGFIGLAFAARSVDREEESFWFGIAGPVLVLYSLTYWTMSEWNEGSAALYLFVGSLMVAAGLHLKHIPLLVGGLGIGYAFVFRLVFDTFEGSPFMPVAIAVVGLSMIALSIGYQRLGRPLRQPQEH